jgi:predicted DNA-binding protein with PD1-like motif
VPGWFDWRTREYLKIPIVEQVEVVSFIGNIARSPDGESGLHAHVAVAKRDGSAWGAHLLEAHVRPTLEVVLTESPRNLQRKYDPETRTARLLL